MEEEKRELIEAINEIRKELGLQPYPLGHLEVKSIEELRKFYSTHFRMREDYKKRLKEEKKFKLNWKVGLLILCIAIVPFLLLFSQFFKPIEEAIRKTVTPSPEEKKVTEERILKFIVTFGYVEGNDPVLILFNQGNTNITSFNVSVDDGIKEYEVVSGSLPLKPYDSLYFRLAGLCDNKTHLIEVATQNVTTNFTLTDQCEIGSKL
jgi:hypothetical protein